MNRDYLREGLDGAEEDNVQKSYLGVLDTKVVGLNHYQGHVSSREMVVIARDRDNPYDKWAIRVLNVQEVQVGHVPRDVVMHLSPLMDEGKLFLEGLVPRGTNHVYKMPLSLFVFAPAGQEASVRATLAAKRLHVMADAEAERMFERSSQQSVGGSQDAAPSSMPSAVLRATPVEDSLSCLFKDLLTEALEVPTMEASERIVTPLLSHQRESLAWMVGRENGGSLPPFWEPHKALTKDSSVAYANTLTNFVTAHRPDPFRGGILADDMGLGKTLTVLSLIATNHAGAKLPEVRMEPRRGGTPAETGASAGSEHAEESARKIRKSSKSGKSSTRASTPSAAPVAAGASPPRVRKQTPAQRKIAEAAEEQVPLEAAPPADGPHATLVVCPVSVLSNWESQVREHSEGRLRLCVYHGPSRAKHNAASLRQHDIVLTTYGVMVSDKSLLTKVKWLRVVLDEGHFIKNASTRQSKAAAELPSRFRWIVSGTPIQNSLSDLFGLLSFLHLGPLNQRDIFRASLERPLKLGDTQALIKLKVLLGSIALRRLKTSTINGRSIVQLPQKTINFVRVDLVGEQRNMYDRWQLAGQRIVSQHLEASTLFANYSTVLEVILRLRQICDAESLCPDASPKGLEDAPAARADGRPLSACDRQTLVLKLLTLLSSGAIEECPICMDDVSGAVITACGHVFCRGCIENWLINQEPAVCPMCRSDVSKATLVEAPPVSEAAPEATERAPVSEQVPAKLEKLMETLQANEAAVPDGGPPLKAVVFSQFTGMLSLVTSHLKAAGIPHIRIDGAIPTAKRRTLLEAFASVDAASPRVAVVSLKAGGVGLNLVSASQVHLLDPWWNPATEEQAMDRVHRIGQKRTVDVFRYVCRDTIEERMVELQERKRQLASGAFERRKPEETQAARLQDVKLLMEL